MWLTNDPLCVSQLLGESPLWAFLKLHWCILQKYNFCIKTVVWASIHCYDRQTNNRRHIITVASHCMATVGWTSKLHSSVFQTFLLEWNPLKNLDCSRNPRNDIRVWSIPYRQKPHSSVLSNLHTGTPLVQVYVCNTVIVAQIKNKLVWPE